MKFVSLVTALLVVGGLYMLIFERDTLLNFAQTSSPVEAPETVETSVESQTTATDKAVVEDVVFDAVRVVALASTATDVDSAVILRGRTEAAREVTVAAETSGLVISEPIDNGAFVEAGDMLCELDPGTREASLAEAKARLAEAQGRVPEAQAAIAEANARLREANINVDNTRQLNQRGVSSETQLISMEAMAEAALAGLQRAQSGVASAEAGIEAAAAAVAAAEAEIDRLVITAPFSGLLETKTAELGSLMQPGTPCATIVQLDPIKLVGFVPELERGKVQIGAPAFAKLTSGEEITGQVTFISRSADDTTRTFRVEVDVPNADQSISAGQTVEIVIASDGRLAHLVPQSALTLDDAGTLGVRTVGDGDVVKFMPVTLLRDTVDGVWLTDLPETVNIITIGQEFVVDGVVVAPTYEEAKG
ncbi:MAG: efflux RND transporter periplasmic adaptor subunit [Pseudomonadota bacterium]